MFNFEYYAPTKVVFGKDTVNKIGKLIKNRTAGRFSFTMEEKVLSVPAY